MDYSLNLRDFINGLIQLGLRLSKQQMERLFNLMDTGQQHIISEHDFLTFLDVGAARSLDASAQSLRHVLLTEITHSLRSKRAQALLSLSECTHIAYIPSASNSRDALCADYEDEIARLRAQLETAIDTLHSYTQTHGEVIDENRKDIAQLQRSLLRQKEADIEAEAQALIESSLSPANEYNPREWDEDDVADWLQMIQLADEASHTLVEAFRARRIDGHKLLSELCEWDRARWRDEMRVERDEDAAKLMREIATLKQTAPPMDDQDETGTETAGQWEEAQQQQQATQQEVVQLIHRMSVQQEQIDKHHEHINEMANAEIVRLKEELHRIEQSKVELIVSTSAELQKLRDIISDRHVAK